MKRQPLRMLLLLSSFAVFPITVVFLAPGPPVMSLRAGVINLSVLTILTIFLSGLVLRRAFCGWLCPGGGCQLVSQALNDKKFKHRKLSWLRGSLVLAWAALMMVALFTGDQPVSLDLGHPGAGKFASSPIRYLLPYIPVVVFIFLFVFLFGRRGFCHRGCWIYPIIALSTRIGTFVRAPSLHVRVRRPESCRDCKLCSRNCSMSIDVLRCVKEETPLPKNCIQCGLCVDKCPKAVLGFAFGTERTRVQVRRLEPGTARDAA